MVWWGYQVNLRITFGPWSNGDGGFSMETNKHRCMAASLLSWEGCEWGLRYEPRPLLYMGFSSTLGLRVSLACVPKMGQHVIDPEPRGQRFWRARRLRRS